MFASTSTAADTAWDSITVGGGLAGSVVDSRLSTLVMEQPDVGRNLADHSNLALGFQVHVPKEGLVAAIAEEGANPDSTHPLLANDRTFLEHAVLHADLSLSPLPASLIHHASPPTTRAPPWIAMSREAIRIHLKIVNDATTLGRETNL
ncbi:hypothetical protein B0I35DRAFT_510674 [Stachybotrys elegans]|uniref:Glucose-methanol-choline oxidoreductase N-terminal domain-containing protein n=1 Tax=Stachybotrys elegans TaxID=80388 RepID=A0A8K0SSL7_9HYPO|nr:hypothetical protein B0I35DRAFT_510674 [Stachybotrys elegans]